MEQVSWAIRTLAPTLASEENCKRDRTVYNSVTYIDIYIYIFLRSLVHSAVADTFFCGRTQRRTQQRCNPKQTNMECKLLSLGNMLTVRVDGKISQCASNAGMLWGHRLMRSELPAKPTKRRAGRKDWPILHAILCRLDQRIYDNRMEMCYQILTRKQLCMG